MRALRILCVVLVSVKSTIRTQTMHYARISKHQGYALYRLGVDVGVCVGSRTETAVAVGATTVYHLRRLDLVRNTLCLKSAHVHGSPN